MADPRFFDYVLPSGGALDGKLVALHADERAFVLTGGTVIDGRGGRLEATVIVRGERIVQLVPATEPHPAELESATRIDCSGLTIVPGMFDLHVHFMGTSEHDRFLSYLSPQPGVRLLRMGFEAYQLLAHGFTTILDLGHGDADHVYGLRAAIAEGIIRGPRTFHVGWYLSPSHANETPLHQDMTAELRVTLHTPTDGEAEIRALIRANAADGADWTKFFFTTDQRPGEPWYTPRELRALVDESHAHGLRVACHVKAVEAVRAAVEAGVDCLEHGPDVVDERLLDLIARNEIFLVPTLAVYHRVVEVAAEFGYAPTLVDAIRRELDGRMRNVAAARERGIRIGVGSDVGARSGFGTLAARELALLEECGFSPMQAISAATSISADSLGIGHEVGSIAPGQLAELVVIDGDPLVDITVFQRPETIRHVFQAVDRLAPEHFPHPTHPTDARLGRGSEVHG